LLEDGLTRLVEPHTAGDPMGAGGCWLNVRLRSLRERLSAVGHRVSIPVISRLLRKRDFRLRVNTKQEEGASPAERDAQFVYLQAAREQFSSARQPVVSVDTKKKELIGNFKNAGRAWRKEAQRVNVHDFPSQAEGRAVPYGIYDLLHNQGSVYVGDSADTAEFAVDSIADWCSHQMRERFPQATSLLIHADCGGSNANRCRLWKQQLQEKIADRFRIDVTVCHYPTGCSKWNPIEHRLFSQISKSWAGCPLESFETMLGYIQDTRTDTGLTVTAHRVRRDYVKGQRVTDEQMASLAIEYHPLCPQWNYTIRPRTHSQIPVREVIR
jgi:hypothetical protein